MIHLNEPNLLEPFLHNSWQILLWNISTSRVHNSWTYSALFHYLSDLGRADRGHFPMAFATSFAIFGLGKLGREVLSALLDAAEAETISIHILTRLGSDNVFYYPPNVRIFQIDYDDAEKADLQLEEALRKIDVVISTVGAGVADPVAEVAKLKSEGKHCGFIPGFANQVKVARAAKKADCKLFLPALVNSHSTSPGF